MLRHMFIIPLIALSILGVADTVRAMNARTSAASQESRSSLPNLNIEDGCRTWPERSQQNHRLSGLHCERAHDTRAIAKGVGVLPGRYA